MMVAEIAWVGLSGKVRARATELLQQNPDYEHWVADVPLGKRDHFAFVRASTWADAIKTEAGYVDEGNSARRGAAAGQSPAYADPMQHRQWHYIDVPLTMDGTALVPPVAPNVETQIALFEHTIHSRSAAGDLKSYALVWLLHLVGDVHQPLHAVSRFSADLPDGDRGGNRVALCVRPCRRELHGYWDEILGTTDDPAVAMKAADRLPPADRSRASIAGVRHWVRESVDIARRFAYAPPVGPGQGPYALDAAYEDTSWRIARERIELAGARLAHLLNSQLR